MTIYVFRIITEQVGGGGGDQREVILNLLDYTKTLHRISMYKKRIVQLQKNESCRKRLENN